MESLAEGRLKLPDLILLEDHKGDWEAYLSALYALFKDDFINSRPIYKRKSVVLKKLLPYKSKDATFWHLISNGPKENERLPDLRRCERIKWIRHMITNCNHQEIKVWENMRRRDRRVCICFGEWEYLVVLGKRSRYYILCTAYPVTRSHTMKKLEKEYLRCTKKANTAPKGGIHTPSTHGR